MPRSRLGVSNDEFTVSAEYAMQNVKKVGGVTVIETITNQEKLPLENLKTPATEYDTFMKYILSLGKEYEPFAMLIRDPILINDNCGITMLRSGVISYFGVDARLGIDAENKTLTITKSSTSFSWGMAYGDSYIVSDGTDVYLIDGEKAYVIGSASDFGSLNEYHLVKLDDGTLIFGIKDGLAAIYPDGSAKRIELSYNSTKIRPTVMYDRDNDYIVGTWGSYFIVLDKNLSLVSAYNVKNSSGFNMYFDAVLPSIVGGEYRLLTITPTIISVDADGNVSSHKELDLGDYYPYATQTLHTAADGKSAFTVAVDYGPSQDMRALLYVVFNSDLTLDYSKVAVIKDTDYYFPSDGVQSVGVISGKYFVGALPVLGSSDSEYMIVLDDGSLSGDGTNMLVEDVTVSVNDIDLPIMESITPTVTEVQYSPTLVQKPTEPDATMEIIEILTS